MRILVITNLYPPHHAGTYEFRCEAIVEGLVSRGHDVHVLTSNHGMTREQNDERVSRRLRLNGVYDHPLITIFQDLKEVELHNNGIVSEVIKSFAPEVIYVFSLHGLSKSLIFTFHHLFVPVVYDVSDYWISGELAHDPWLSWWNRPKLPFKENMMRSGMEIAGQRDKFDETAPTRDNKQTKRLSHIFDTESDEAGPQPNSISTFRFTRAFFCSTAMKNDTVLSGYQMEQASVIHPGVPVQHYHSPVKPASSTANRLLLFSKLHKESGLMTALKALSQVRAQNHLCTMSVYGRGDSDYIAQLRSFVIRADLPVTFLNAADPYKDMPAVYRQHDIFIHPAEWAEPYSAAQMEAMAAGLPVISSACGGAGEILRNADNALTFEPGSESELADRIMALQANGELRQRIATSGQSDVTQYYDSAIVLRRIEDYLQQTIELGPYAV